MVRIYVNHYGWVMGGSPETGLKFTPHKAGAKPFPSFSKELMETRIYIEGKMLCHYDIVEER